MNNRHYNMLQGYLSNAYQMLKDLGKKKGKRLYKKIIKIQKRVNKYYG